jgi:hypothetical protein
MTQALYAHMNNKTIKKKYRRSFSKLRILGLRRVVTNMALFYPGPTHQAKWKEELQHCSVKCQLVVSIN